MNTQEFAVIPAGKPAQLFALLIGLVLPIVLVLAMLLAANGRDDWQKVSAVALLLPILGAGLGWSMHRRTIQLSDGGLRVRRLPWPLTFKPAELDLEHARIVDLEDHPELRPRLKIAGTGLPGYRVGHFWLGDRRRAYVVLTELRRVLVLPRRDGGLVLLSVQRPEALLDALRQPVR